MSTDRAQHRFTVGERARLEVEITSGEVRVRTGTAGTVSVTIETAEATQVEVEQIGDTVVVRRPRSWSARKRHVVVTAEVPDGTDITISSTSADARLEGSFGNCRVSSVSGQVTVDRMQRAEVDSTSGNVQLQATGTLDVSSISGDVAVGRVGGRLKASLTSGNLRADHVEGDVDIATMSGDVVIGCCDGDELSVRSVSGDLKLGLPSGIRVEPEINTVSGRTTLPSAAATPTSSPRRRVRLRVRSVSGDIRIERA